MLPNGDSSLNINTLANKSTANRDTVKCPFISDRQPDALTITNNEYLKGETGKNNRFCFFWVFFFQRKRADKNGPYETRRLGGYDFVKEANSKRKKKEKDLRTTIGRTNTGWISGRACVSFNVPSAAAR